MNSLGNKIGNLSIYDVRKAARSAQNSLFASNVPIEQLIRSATNTDPWGPSTKQMEKIHQQSMIEDAEDVIDVLIHRISEYLESASTSSVSKRKQSFYNKAVHYVNSGNEWRIINKSLKVLEYLILHSGKDYVLSIQRHKGLLKRVSKVYEYEDKGGPPMITTAELERKDHFNMITKNVSEVIKLLDDDDYRNSQVEKAMRTLNLSSVSNNAPMVYKSRFERPNTGFKVKHMNSTKVQNSNAKDEVRNHLGHIIQSSKSLPGKYEEFNGENNLLDEFDDEGFNNDETYDERYDELGDFQTTGFKDESYDETYDERYDEFGDFQTTGFKDESYDEIKEPLPKTDTEISQDTNDDDDFGDFQASPKTPKTTINPTFKEQELLSFDDQPVTPTNPTITTFDTFFTTITSPTSSKPSTGYIKDGSTIQKTSDTFADLFKSAKGST